MRFLKIFPRIVLNYTNFLHLSQLKYILRPVVHTNVFLYVDIQLKPMTVMMINLNEHSNIQQSVGLLDFVHLLYFGPGRRRRQPLEWMEVSTLFPYEGVCAAVCIGVVALLIEAILTVVNKPTVFGAFVGNFTAPYLMYHLQFLCYYKKRNSKNTNFNPKKNNGYKYIYSLHFCSLKVRDIK